RPPPITADRALDLAAEHADLVPQRQQLNRLRPCCRGADEREVEEPADQAIHQEEEHQAIVPTRCSWETEYSDPPRHPHGPHTPPARSSPTCARPTPLRTSSRS